MSSGVVPRPSDGASRDGGRTRGETMLDLVQVTVCQQCPPDVRRVPEVGYWNQVANASTVRDIALSRRVIARRQDAEEIVPASL